MYFIAAFGLLMMCLSMVMIANPNYWSDSIVRFSKKAYFHWFEVITRFISGLLFALYHKSTLHPNLLLGLGLMLMVVSVGLIMFGAVKHRQFVIWSVHKFNKIFRYAGFASFIFGIFLIYSANIV